MTNASRPTCPHTIEAARILGHALPLERRAAPRLTLTLALAPWGALAGLLVARAAGARGLLTQLGTVSGC